MTVHLQAGEVTEIFVGSGGTKQVLEGWIGTAAGNRQFYAALSSVSLPVTELIGFQSQSLVTTGPITVSHEPASASPTYNWRRVSGDAISANSPNSATTTFSGGVPQNNTRVAIFVCDVTVGSTTLTTPQLEVTLTRFTFGGF